MVILSGNIDLSVGSMVGFSAIMVGMIIRDNPEFPVWAAFVLSTLIGLGLGMFNGLLVSVLSIPAIIVTLGTLNLYRGLLFIIGGGRQIDPNHIPRSMIALAQKSPIFNIPWIVIFAAIFAIATWVFMKYTHSGKEIYAVGSNSQAARLRGISVNKIIFMVYSITGALSGFAGMVYAARNGYINPSNTGYGFEFVVISAVIVGGTSINGGSGSVLGTVLGCFLLAVIHTALPVLGVSGLWQQAIYGFIIILALVMDKTVQNNQMKQVLKRGVRV